MSDTEQDKLIPIPCAKHFWLYGWVADESTYYCQHCDVDAADVYSKEIYRTHEPKDGKLVPKD